MKKRRFSVFRLFLAVLVVAFAAGAVMTWERAVRDPVEVRTLKKQEVETTDQVHQEYYFNLLDDDEKRGYREILTGVRAHEEKFYLSLGGDDQIDRVYHAVLKDHPEIFWIHNREKVFKTTYEGRDYCRFSPGYAYTEEQCREITQAMEAAYQEMAAQIPEGADDYQKVMTAYTYIIDHTAYEISDDDQSIAGVFWKKKAVCAGYAGAVQYLLERLEIPCIYVEGDAAIMWMPPMETSLSFWKEMRLHWLSTRPRSMIIFVLFLRNMRKIIHHRRNFRFRHVQPGTKIST